jgi:hypothetical protein
MAKMYRRRKRSAAEATKYAAKLEARAAVPTDPDDPAWLRRRAESLRLWAEKRTKGKELKADERRKVRRKKGTPPGA